MILQTLGWLCLRDFEFVTPDFQTSSCQYLCLISDCIQCGQYAVSTCVSAGLFLFATLLGRSNLLWPESFDTSGEPYSIQHFSVLICQYTAWGVISLQQKTLHSVLTMGYWFRVLHSCIAPKNLRKESKMVRKWGDLGLSLQATSQELHRSSLDSMLFDDFVSVLVLTSRSNVYSFLEDSILPELCFRFDFRSVLAALISPWQVNGQISGGGFWVAARHSCWKGFWSRPNRSD